jgi:hypothetical protein
MLRVHPVIHPRAKICSTSPSTAEYSTRDLLRIIVGVFQFYMLVQTSFAAVRFVTFIPKRAFVVSSYLMSSSSVSFPLLVCHMHHVLHEIFVLFLLHVSDIVLILLDLNSQYLRSTVLPRSLLSELTMLLNAYLLTSSNIYL